MKKAIWNGEIIAESDKTIEVEGNLYFPPESLKKDFLKDSSHQSLCPWKGRASYFSIEVNGEENKDAAWYYKEPSNLAGNIKNYVAFWKGVEIK